MVIQAEFRSSLVVFERLLHGSGLFKDFQQASDCILQGLFDQGRGSQIVLNLWFRECSAYADIDQPVGRIDGGACFGQRFQPGRDIHIDVLVPVEPAFSQY